MIQKDMFLRKCSRTIIAVCASSIPLGALADDKTAAPALSDVLDASGVSLTGYFDAAYNSMNSTGLFTSAASGTSYPGGVAQNTHIFDTPGATSTHDFNSFNLQQFAVILAKQPREGFGGYLNLTTGQDAATIASTGLGGGNNNHMFDMTQAYASYATGSLTVIGGKFATLAGAELITSPSNKNYTHSWMFGWGPYTHTGLRATYAASDKVTLIAGVNNGWDQVNSTTSSKTAELGLDITPSSLFSLATTYYQGKENAQILQNGTTPVGGVGNRKYLDMVGTLNATEKLNFVFDYANGSQGNAAIPGAAGSVGTAKWDSLALYANYQISDTWRFSYRNESFNDRDGYRSNLTGNSLLDIPYILGTPVAQRLKSNTFTVGYIPIKNVELRGEIRFDKSSQNAFLQPDGTGRSTQNTYAMDAVYQF